MRVDTYACHIHLTPPLHTQGPRHLTHAEAGEQANLKVRRLRRVHPMQMSSVLPQRMWCCGGSTNNGALQDQHIHACMYVISLTRYAHVW